MAQGILSMARETKKKAAIAYVVVQLVIWLKSAVFYLEYGRGKVLLFSMDEFPPLARAFDFWFHTTGHVAIAVLALLFGAATEKLEAKTAAVVFVAVAMHNLAYWLTRAHPNALYSAIDFASDSVLLALFILAGHLAWRKVGIGGLFLGGHTIVKKA